MSLYNVYYNLKLLTESKELFYNKYFITKKKYIDMHWSAGGTCTEPLKFSLSMFFFNCVPK